MPSSTELLPTVWSGRQHVLRSRVVVAPAGTMDEMRVVVVNYSNTHHYDVPSGNWMPGARLPLVGDTCVLLLDDDGDGWVPAGEWGNA